MKNMKTLTDLELMDHVGDPKGKSGYCSKPKRVRISFISNGMAQESEYI